ncbi:MAG: helix-turn-helix transcriptional regulator [Methanobacteriota archaeon]
MESTGIAGFVFELASDQRLGILAAVAEKPLRHAEIARRLRMTDSETSRHLNRLSAAGLVTKNPRGEHELTSLARLLSAGLPFFRFLTANREFLLTHDVLVLPPEFVDRLGALSEGTFTRGTYRVVATQERFLRAVKQRIWVLTEQAFEQALPILRQKAVDGADVRVIRPREGFEDAVLPTRVRRNYPARLLDRIPIFLAVLDDAAGVCFPSFDGSVDMSTMLLLEDARGCGWAADLFLRFWERARERPGEDVRPV